MSEETTTTIRVKSGATKGTGDVTYDYAVELLDDLIRAMPKIDSMHDLMQRLAELVSAADSCEGEVPVRRT